MSRRSKRLDADTRDGTSQAGRSMPALATDYVAIDERGPAELLAFVRAYLEELRYYGDDNLPAGSWAALLDDGETSIEELVAYLSDPSAAPEQRKRWLGRPHLALLLTFVELLGHAREQLNGLGERHLDHYYERVLGLRPRGAEADRAAVVLGLDDRSARLRLPAGTEFRAGVDSQGKARVYRSERDVYLSRAAIAQLRSVFVDLRVTGLADPPRDPDLSQPEAFETMLGLTLGSPAPGDPVPDYGDAAVTAAFVASCRERLRFGPDALFLEHHELRSIMHLRARRADSAHEWARINALLRVEAPADPRDFQANFDAAVGGPLDYSGLPQVEDVDDLFFWREREDVAAFIEQRLPFPAADFVALMQIKQRIDGEWAEINRMLRLAAERQRGVLSYAFAPEDPTSFDTNLAAALGDAWPPAWPPGVADLDGYVDDVRALEAHFASSAERLLRIAEIAALVLDAKVEADTWTELIGLLTQAHRERDYAGRRAELGARRAELPAPDGPEALDALTREVLVASDDADWSALKRSLAELIAKPQIDILDRFRTQLADVHAPRMLGWDDAYRVLELAWRIRAELPESIPEQVEWRNIHAHEDATAVVVDDGGDPPRWRTFGQVAERSGPAEVAPDPILGLALRSPLLAVSEGGRALTLTIGFEPKGFSGPRLSAALEARALVAQVSTAEGLIEVEIAGAEVHAGGEGTGYWALLGREPEAEHDLPALRLTLTLSPRDEPVAPVNDEPAAWPTLRLMLRQLWDEDRGGYYCEYSALRGLHLAAIHLGVSVDGLGNLELRGDDRTIDGKKPFEPFGRAPVVGSRLYFSHPELTRARLDSLALDVEWMGLPRSLAAHYANYPDVESATDFRVQLSLAEGGLELTLASDLALFAETGAERLTAPSHSLELGDLPGTLAELHPWLVYGPAADAGRARVKDPRETKRYFVLELQPTDFGHQDYPGLSARLARSFSVALARGVDLSTDDARAAYEIEPPYTPKIKSLQASYSASIELRFDGGVSSTSGADELLHVHPFGVSEAARVPDELGMRGPRLLPAYDNAGELYIGLRELELPQKLTTLFQLAEGSADPDVESLPLTWSVLDGEVWRSLDVSHDGSSSLMTSGTVELELEPVAARDPSRTLLPAALCWLRLSIPRHPSSRCDAVALHTQALTVRFDDRGNALDHYAERLPVGSIDGLLEPRTEIRTVSQPYTGYGGRPPERAERFRTRVSERLRHKQRALSPWDYERLVLDRFPQLYKVKCLRSTAREPNKVRVVVVPNVHDQLPRDPFAPKVSADLLAEIADALRSLSPGLAEIEVKNPSYVSVMTRLGVRFMPGVDEGYARRQLIEDLNCYLAPWAYEQGADLSIGGRIYANSIIDFIERRDYVDYLAEVRLFRSLDGENFSLVLPPDAGGYHVGSDRPDQILVPARTHQIDVIDERGYEQAAFAGIQHMKLELDFMLG